MFLWEQLQCVVVAAFVSVCGLGRQSGATGKERYEILPARYRRQCVPVTSGTAAPSWTERHYWCSTEVCFKRIYFRFVCQFWSHHFLVSVLLHWQILSKYNRSVGPTVFCGVRNDIFCHTVWHYSRHSAARPEIDLDSQWFMHHISLSFSSSSSVTFICMIIIYKFVKVSLGKSESDAA